MGRAWILSCRSYFILPQNGLPAVAAALVRFVEVAVQVVAGTAVRTSKALFVRAARDSQQQSIPAHLTGFLDNSKALIAFPVLRVKDFGGPLG